MLDKLVEFLLNLIDKILPLIIIKQYQQGVFFTFGKFKKIIGPGIHAKIPFFDDIDIFPVVTTTIPLHAQSVITKDGIEVVIKAQIKYKIENLEVFCIEVYDAINALSDTSSGIIFSVIKEHTYEECRELDLNEIITDKVRSEAKTWGLKVNIVTITDFSKMRSIRLFNESTPHTNG